MDYSTDEVEGESLPFKTYLEKLEKEVKYTIQIDGLNVYIKSVDVNVDNKLMIDWFTLRDDKMSELEKEQLGQHVENAIKNIMKENKCSSKTLFSRIWSTIKSIFV